MDVLIIPVYFDEEEKDTVENYCSELQNELVNSSIEVEIDESGQSPWELMQNTEGVVLAVEIQDVEDETVGVDFDDIVSREDIVEEVQKRL